MSAYRCEAGPRIGQAWPLTAPARCRRVLRFRSLVLCTAMIIPFAAMTISVGWQQRPQARARRSFRSGRTSPQSLEGAQDH